MYSDATIVGFERLHLAVLRFRIRLPLHLRRAEPMRMHAVGGLCALAALLISASIPAYAKSVQQPAVEPTPAYSVVELESITPTLPAVTIEINSGEYARSERGVFFTPSSIADQEFTEWTIEQLQKANGNTIIFDVKGSEVHFATDVPMANELGLVDATYELADVLPVLEAHNIHAIARYIAVKDMGITAKKPETQLHSPSGAVVSPRWVDPSHPDVLEYNSQIICDLAASGIEEINLDYIRFRPEDQAGLQFLTQEERITKIETFVRMARETIDRCGPTTRLGISTFAILGWEHDANIDIIGQDIERLAPLVDVVSPMAYNANFSLDKYWPEGDYPRGRWSWLPYRTLIGYAELLGDDSHKLRPWLQGFNATRDEMIAQIHGVYDAGVCGFTFWNADNAYTDVYAAMRRVEVPAECKTK